MERLESTPKDHITNLLQEHNDLSVYPTIEEDLKAWTKTAERSEFLSQFWLVCPDERLDTVVSALLDKLQIVPEDLVRIEIPNEGIIMPDELVALKDFIQGAKGERVLLVLDKFERKILPNYPADITVHGFTQTIAQSQAVRSALKDLGKKIIIVIHIGQSRGLDVYHLATGAAARTKFSDGIIKIRDLER